MCALQVQIHDSSFAVLFTLNALTCHYRSNCYDNSNMSEGKKKTAFTGNFQLMPVRTASLFSCTKASVVQSAFSQTFFWSHFHVKLSNL